jgi:hypothetical protein
VDRAAAFEAVGRESESPRGRSSGTAVPTCRPIRARLTDRHARLHASVHEVRRNEAARGVSSSATWRAEAPDVVPRVFCGVRARVLPEESRGAEGAAASECRGHQSRQSSPHHRLPRDPPVCRLRGDGHCRPRVRPLSDKIADVSDYASSGRTWSRIEAEIDKCDVRCANCHRRKTRATLFPQRDTVELRPVLARPRPAQLTLDAALGLRTCRVCKETKPLTEFPFRSITRQTRQWICLSCQRTYTKGWYQRNRKKQIAAAYVRRVREARTLGRRIREYLGDHPCVDCGESDPDVLDFDHLRNKRANVSRLVHIAVSWDVILAEIAKCEVRCANCHRRRTANIRGHYRAVDARMKAEALTR